MLRARGYFFLGIWQKGIYECEGAEKAHIEAQNKKLGLLIPPRGGFGFK